MRVLDAHAVLAYLGKEPGWQTVERRLREASTREPLRMCVVNWGEVLYVVARRRGPAEAEEVATILDYLPIKLEPADAHLARAAAMLKTEHRAPYCDCFAAALAQRLDAPLVTGDPDFRAFGEALTLDWIT